VDLLLVLIENFLR